MARSIRIEYPGAMYHVMARGNRREKIFWDQADRSSFWRLTPIARVRVHTMADGIGAQKRPMGEGK